MRDPSLGREARLGFVGWWAGRGGAPGAFTLGLVVLWFPPLGLRLPVRVEVGMGIDETRGAFTIQHLGSFMASGLDALAVPVGKLGLI